MVDAGLKPSDQAICSLISVLLLLQTFERFSNMFTKTSCNSGLVANEGVSRCIQLLKRVKV